LVLHRGKCSASSSDPFTLPPGKEHPDTIGQEAQRVPEMVDVMAKKKSLSLPGIEVQGSSPKLVTLLTELSQPLSTSPLHVKTQLHVT